MTKELAPKADCALLAGQEAEHQRRVLSLHARRGQDLYGFALGLGLPDEDSADADALWQAVDGLPERQRAVLYLRYRADLPFDRIGLVLGITSGAIAQVEH